MPRFGCGSEMFRMDDDVYQKMCSDIARSKEFYFRGFGLWS